jgi:RNA polymerase sigma-70 factor (family 1)
MRKISEFNEHELVENIHTNKCDVFSMLFKEWYRPICHYAFSILNDTADAEDITDECFMKLWERRAKFETVLHCKSFLFVCVRNASINVLVRRKVELNAKKELGFWGHREMPENNPEDPFLQLQKALDKLPPARRKIFTMLYREGKSSREIALELNLSVQTVKNQRQRGISYLRKLLLSSLTK